MAKQITHAEEWINAEQAQIYLDANERNRKVKPATVATYARDMTNGNWNYTAAPIRFDTNGNLLDGQHRLRAVVASGKRQKFLVVRNLPPETRKNIDNGARRSVADNLVMDFDLRNAAAFASYARLIIRWRGGYLRNSEYFKASDQEVYDFVIDNEDTLQHAQGYAQRIRRAIPMSQAAAGAAFHETYRVEPDRAKDFWEKVISGAELKQGDPALSFRNAVFRVGPSHQDRTLLNLELACRAWRYHMEGRTTGVAMQRKSLRQITEGDFTLVVPEDLED
jgi:hypothetical protein